MQISELISTKSDIPILRGVPLIFSLIIKVYFLNAACCPVHRSGLDVILQTRLRICHNSIEPNNVI